MREEDPLLVHRVLDKNLGLLGYLVIDTAINGCSSGCIRMLPTPHGLRDMRFSSK